MKNKENQLLFYQPEDAENWVWRVNNGVGNWVRERGNKSFWYLVMWVSIHIGVLKEGTTMAEFSRLLIQECEEELAESDTADKIYHSMEKFQYKRNLKYFEKQMEKSLIRDWVNEVSLLLTKDIQVESTPTDFTLEGRMEEYLNNSISSEPYKKICIRPIYNGKTATMSVESYVSQYFMDTNRPTSKVIFECVDETLTEEKVEMLYGRFGSMSNTKLFIASTHSFSCSVKKEAESHSIGLVLVDPKHIVNENNFILPRSQGSQDSEVLLWNKMLVGEEKMTEPILAYDRQRIDNSLSFVLYKYASCDKDNLFVTAPVLSDRHIEKEALRLVKPQVNLFVSQLRQCSVSDKVPTCEIDPYKIAEDMGLSVDRGKTGRNLSQIDVVHKKVTLSTRLEANKPRDRFSMAHEIGHHIFHVRVSKKLEDGRHHIVSNTKRWLEHQAHHFASCLLMPAPVIRLLYDIYWKKEFKSEKVRPIHVNKDYYDDPVFQHVVAPIARKMNVSLQATYIRLKKLGLCLMR